MFHLLRGRLSDLYYGWRMIAVGSVLRILGGGLYFYGFSVFFLPLSQDLNLSRASTSLVFSLARAQGAFEGPIAGYFMDRYGPRPLIILALFMTGVGHMLLSGVNSYVMLLIVYMGVVSLSFHAGFMDAPMLIANTWFIRKRTMARPLAAVSPLSSSACHWLFWCVARRKASGCCPTATLLSTPIAPLPVNLNRAKRSTLLSPKRYARHPFGS